MRPYKKETLDYIYLRYMKNKHENLTNEITGAYYEEPTSWLTIILVTLGVMIVACSLIYVLGVMFDY